MGPFQLRIFCDSWVWQMSVQGTGHGDKTTPGLKLPSSPAVQHSLDPCCQLKSQLMALINGTAAAQGCPLEWLRTLWGSVGTGWGDRLDQEHHFHIQQSLEQQDEFERVPQSFRRLLCHKQAPPLSRTHKSLR